VLGVFNFCIHGYNVLAKGRRLKRTSTLLKHARFLNNLQITPVLPYVAGIGQDGSMAMDMEGAELTE